MNGRGGVFVTLSGVVILVGSCVAFPGQSGPDYTGTNVGSLFGGLLGIAVIGAGFFLWTRRDGGDGVA